MGKKSERSKRATMIFQGSKLKKMNDGSKVKVDTPKDFKNQEKYESKSPSTNDAILLTWLLYEPSKFYKKEIQNSYLNSLPLDKIYEKYQHKMVVHKSEKDYSFIIGNEANIIEKQISFLDKTDLFIVLLYGEFDITDQIIEHMKQNNSCLFESVISFTLCGGINQSTYADQILHDCVFNKSEILGEIVTNYRVFRKENNKTNIFGKCLKSISCEMVCDKDSQICGQCNNLRTLLKSRKAKNFVLDEKMFNNLISEEESISALPFNQQNINMENDDTLVELLKKTIKEGNLSSNLRMVYEQQMKYLNLKNKTGVRWSPEYIKYCLSLKQIVGQRGFQKLTNDKENPFWLGPSVRTLTDYFSSIEIKPGIEIKYLENVFKPFYGIETTSVGILACDGMHVKTTCF
jgi:hypothetical protein